MIMNKTVVLAASKSLIPAGIWSKESIFIDGPLWSSLFFELPLCDTDRYYYPERMVSDNFLVLDPKTGKCFVYT